MTEADDVLSLAQVLLFEARKDRVRAVAIAVRDDDGVVTLHHAGDCTGLADGLRRLADDIEGDGS